MSVRLFAGYFVALAACAIVAFGVSEPEPVAPPFSAEAGMMPMGFPANRVGYPLSFPAVTSPVRSHKPAPKRIQLADAR